jgi:hypothetical protein
MPNTFLLISVSFHAFGFQQITDCLLHISLIALLNFVSNFDNDFKPFYTLRSSILHFSLVSTIFISSLYYFELISLYSHAFLDYTGTSISTHASSVELTYYRALTLIHVAVNKSQHS